MLDKQEASRSQENAQLPSEKLELAKLKYDTFLDYYLPNLPSNAIADICEWTITTSRFDAQGTSPRASAHLQTTARSGSQLLRVTEWKKEDSGKMRRVIQTSDGIFTPSDHSSARST